MLRSPLLFKIRAAVRENSLSSCCHSFLLASYTTQLTREREREREGGHPSPSTTTFLARLLSPPPPPTSILFFFAPLTPARSNFLARVPAMRYDCHIITWLCYHFASAVPLPPWLKLPFITRPGAEILPGPGWTAASFAPPLPPPDHPFPRVGARATRSKFFHPILAPALDRSSMAANNFRG